MLQQLTSLLDYQPITKRNSLQNMQYLVTKGARVKPARKNMNRKVIDMFNRQGKRYVLPLQTILYRLITKTSYNIHARKNASSEDSTNIGQCHYCQDWCTKVSPTVIFCYCSGIDSTITKNKIRWHPISQTRLVAKTVAT